MLKIYLASVIICIVVCEISSRATAARLRREGYRRTGKKSIWERMRNMLPLFIPVFNLLVVIAMILLEEKVHEYLVIKLLQNGELEKINR